MAVTKNFLIVDDDLSQRPLWEHLLEKHFLHYRIDWAIDCAGAKDFYRHSQLTGRKYDLFIIDMFLSGSETGFDFLTFLELQREENRILLVSSSDPTKLNELTKNVKLKIDLLAKPLQISEIDDLLI